ncbi:histidine phosphatase family protein [Pontibacter mangrovi]|uniref:Alpha-ribazole phosphatase n=1 Tax=Pontibacter mangrovi TaxID=2589816 RepID=A0A501WFS7_9BACT|nr:histidine phosphatase family protein [Pontibacter mangrovi]TPE45837.1 alpha-ribazole phosphatase [Pontibacter mangrovi]
MKRMILTFVLGVSIACLPASANSKGGHEKTIEQIEQKYRTLAEESAAMVSDKAAVAHAVRFIQPEDQVVEDYSNLRQIALVRHGEPDLVKTGKFSFKEARKFLVDYDSVGIVAPTMPLLAIDNPEEVSLFCSSINRARATAKYLFGEEANVTVSPDFREFETALGKRGLSFRLPIKLWTAAARIKWMLGGAPDGIESFAEAKARARKAAESLAAATEKNPKAVLVAHGFLNRYIKKDLEEMGWRVVRDGGNGYLGTTILVKVEDKAPAPLALSTRD